MENYDILIRILGHPDQFALLNMLGIAGRGGDNADTILVSPFHIIAVQHSINARVAYFIEIRLEQWQDHLGLRIAKTGVKFKYLDALMCQDDASVQHTNEWAAFSPQSGDCWFQHMSSHFFQNFRCTNRRGGVGTHPTRIRSAVIIIQALMVLRGRHQCDGFAITESHHGQLVAKQPLFDHHFGSGAA